MPNMGKVKVGLDTEILSWLCNSIFIMFMPTQGLHRDEIDDDEFGGDSIGGDSIW